MVGDGRDETDILGGMMRGISLASLMVVMLCLYSDVARGLPSQGADSGSAVGITPPARGPPPKFSCGTPPPPDHVLRFHHQMHEEEKARRSRKGITHNHTHYQHDGTHDGTHRPNGTHTNPSSDSLQPRAASASGRNSSSLAPSPDHPQIDMYIHIVSTKADKSVVTDLMISNQFTVLRDTYHAQGYDFTLRNVSRTVNDAWATDTDDAAMKAALHAGSYRAYNLYIQTALVNGSLGHCTIEYDIRPGVDFSRDGCSVAASTLPGGSQARYNLGRTAVHETGHWLGLMHTFEGLECAGPGDYVDDTRVEGESTTGCPAAKNSCPGVAGLDPVHNYMDYSWDSCYEGFTDGQRTRMRKVWDMYRAPTALAIAEAASAA